jgi:hypothetical protein
MWHPGLETISWISMNTRDGIQVEDNNPECGSEEHLLTHRNPENISLGILCDSQRHTAAT